MKALIAEFKQETNSFCPAKTSIKGQEYRVRLGEKEWDILYSTKNEMKGFIDVLDSNNYDIHISATAFLGSGGEVEKQTYDLISTKIFSDIAFHKPDIVLLALHGAMIVEGMPDGTGCFLERCRKEAGVNCIIAVTLDMHANVTPLMVEMADFICGYKEYPHIDLFERGCQAAQLAIKAAKKEILSRTAMVKIPLIIPAEAGKTDLPYMKKLMNKAKDFEDTEEVYSVTISIVQPWLNVEGVGCAVTVHATNDMIARKIAVELAEDIWALREIAVVDLIGLEEAIEQAKANNEKPVLLVDSADSPSAGAPGDSPDAIKGLIEYGGKIHALANIVDPEVVKKAIVVGENNSDSFDLGRKIAPGFGKPITINGTVKCLMDGKFRFKGPMYTGIEYDRGKIAVIESAGISIVVMEKPVDNSDPEMYRSAGLCIESADAIVVKTATGFRSPYEGLYSKAIILKTAGASNSNLVDLPFDNIGWSVYPFNRNFKYLPALTVAKPNSTSERE